MTEYERVMKENFKENNYVDSAHNLSEIRDWERGAKSWHKSSLIGQKQNEGSRRRSRLLHKVHLHHKNALQKGHPLFRMQTKQDKWCWLIHLHFLLKKCNLIKLQWHFYLLNQGSPPRITHKKKRNLEILAKHSQPDLGWLTSKMIQSNY